MDLLEHAAIEDVIVLSVVLQEVKARNLAAYSRLRKLCALPDRRFFVFANEHHRSATPPCAPSRPPCPLRRDMAAASTFLAFAPSLPLM